ncbi:MAG: hypothetical protein Tsb0032_04420 [Kiloniellaceae bacterium]
MSSPGTGQAFALASGAAAVQSAWRGCIELSAQRGEGRVGGVRGKSLFKGAAHAGQGGATAGGTV